ncbi:MAG: hypothetical protein P857_656 [Candidatus Xenolissoclinum pacificiensis L6]|uniref:Uncharacterized protein n=1 Tax=Candidatus Xenolissoclinum pacificiensis L6 TaxID=1401685 RepID=W2V147_9RICK|nr:MAG: hypothetical protein P857_656 [Candidatus Xenolissoclinum pacificiensis L6]
MKEGVIISIKINQKTMGRMVIDDMCWDKLKSLLPVGRTRNNVFLESSVCKLERHGGSDLNNMVVGRQVY